MPLLKENIAGIDIGEGSVAAAMTAVARDRSVVLRRVGCQRFDEAEGEDGIVRAIRSLWRQSGFTTHTVASALRSRAVWLKYFHFPAMPEEDIGPALRLEAEASLQLPVAKLAMDWNRNVGGTTRNRVEGALVAIARDEVSRHRRLLERSGLYPIIVDVGCMAVCNLYLHLRGAPPDGDVVCLVSLLHRKADVSVLFGGQAVYPRTLVSRSDTWDGARDDLFGRIRDELRFYEHKLGHPPVTRMVLLEQDGMPSEVRSLLEAQFHVPCERWKPLDEMNTSGGRVQKALARMKPHGAHLATSIGLSLRRGEDE